jgi:hypothetical protein
MTYPLSSDVVAGQPTAAEHYNNLRADSLRLGQSTADSTNLAELLSRGEQNLTIELLGTDRVRVPCSTSLPVVLVVDGYFILRSTVNVDLSTAGKPTGSADNWYLFAVRTAGSTTFSLEVNTSPLESSGRRLIGSFYWTGTAIAAPSIRTSLADTINTLTNHLQFTGCQGRLSMDTTSPVKDAEGATITLHPYKGNLISLYTSGWGWNNYHIEAGGVKPYISPTILTDHVYDIFAYWTGTAVALETLAWTNIASRATALTLTEGLYVKATDPTRLYLGTCLAYLGSYIKDTVTERGLWNFFNRVLKPLEVTDTTATWTYNVPGTWRSPNGADKMVRVVTGLAEDLVDFEVKVNVVGNSSLYGIVGVGIDARDANSATILIHGGGIASARQIAMARLHTVLVAGSHSIYWIETTNGSGTVTFVGGSFSGQGLGGMVGAVMA